MICKSLKKCFYRWKFDTFSVFQNLRTFPNLKKFLMVYDNEKTQTCRHHFSKKFFIFPQTIFLVFAVHIEVLDDIWQRWWPWMSFRQKKKKKERKKEKKSQLWTIPLVKLKNQTPWSKLVLMTTVHSRYLCRVFTVHQEREARRPVSNNQPKIFLICLC